MKDYNINHIPEKTYRYTSNKLSDLEQSMLHPWEVQLLDKIRNYENEAQ